MVIAVIIGISLRSAFILTIVIIIKISSFSLGVITNVINLITVTINAINLTTVLVKIREKIVIVIKTVTKVKTALIIVPIIRNVKETIINIKAM